MVDASSFLGKYSRYSRFRRTIMSPLNWFFSIMGSVFFYGVVASTDSWVKIFSAILISVFICFYLGIYLYVLISDRDRLQTEGSNLEEKALNCLLPDSAKEVLIKAESNNQLLVSAGHTVKESKTVK